MICPSLPRARERGGPYATVEAAQEIADRTGRTPADVVRVLIGLGEMVTATQSLSDESRSDCCHRYASVKGSAPHPWSGWGP